MAEKDKGEVAVTGFPSPQRYEKGQVTLLLPLFDVRAMTVMFICPVH